MKLTDCLLARGLRQGHFTWREVALARSAVRDHRKAWAQGAGTPELSRALSRRLAKSWRLSAVIALSRLVIEQPTLAVWGGLLMVPAMLITVVTLAMRGLRFFGHLLEGAV